jgi:hypothetical protein
MKPNRSHAQSTHPCTSKVIRGGLPSQSYILFQQHSHPITKSITKVGVHSQIFLYRVLTDLIRNYAVDTVLLEGITTGTDVRKYILTRLGEERVNKIREMYRVCVSDIYWSPTTIDVLRGKRDAENYCLGYYLLCGRRYTGYNMRLLVAQNPSVFFTGIERDLHYEGMKQLRHLDFLLRISESMNIIAGPNPRGAIAELAFPVSLEIQRQQRRKDVDIDAIDGTLTHSSGSTALVIGTAHQDAIESIIRSIPFHGRPTFNLILPECQGVPEFSIPPRVIDLAARDGAEQNL